MHQTDARARGCSHVKLWPLARQSDDAIDVVHQNRIDANLTAFVGDAKDLLGGRNGFNFVLKFLCQVDLITVHHQDFCFLFFGRIVRTQFEQKSVQLSFGKVVGSFRFDRVLSRDNQERQFEAMGFSVNGDVAFLHCFQERRMCFRRRSIDFIRQKQLSENRSGTESELLCFHVEDRGACNVRRHQVSSELDASEFAAQNFSDRPNEKSFTKARNTFDQNVAARKQCDQSSFDQFTLPDEDFADLVANGFEKSSRFSIATDDGFARHVDDRRLRCFIECVNGRIGIWR